MTTITTPAVTVTIRTAEASVKGLSIDSFRGTATFADGETFIWNAYRGTVYLTRNARPVRSPKRVAAIAAALA